MSACRNCGSTLDACNAALKEFGEPCCAACLDLDSHQLVATGTTNFADRITDIERLITEEAARHVIFRTNVGQALTRLEARIDLLTERLDAAAIDDTGQLSLRAEIAEARAEAMGAVAEVTEDLPERVDVLERCLAEIERRLKIRRRETRLPGPLPPPTLE